LKRNVASGAKMILQMTPYHCEIAARVTTPPQTEFLIVLIGKSGEVEEVRHPVRRFFLIWMSEFNKKRRFTYGRCDVTYGRHYFDDRDAVATGG
jgi:hypothetical protein